MQKDLGKTGETSEQTLTCIPRHRVCVRDTHRFLSIIREGGLFYKSTLKHFIIKFGGRMNFEAFFTYEFLETDQLEFRFTDIQPTSFCGCGDDSLISHLPGLEQSTENVFASSFTETNPFGGFGFWKKLRNSGPAML